MGRTYSTTRARSPGHTVGRGDQGGGPAHKTSIWNGTAYPAAAARAREYFPAALQVFEDLAAIDTLELLSKAPDPAPAADRRSARSARRCGAPFGARSRRGRGDPDRLRAEHLRQPEVVVPAYAAAGVPSTVGASRALVGQVKTLQGQVESHLGVTRPLRSACPTGAGVDLGAGRGGSATPSTATSRPSPQNYAGTSRSPAPGQEEVAPARFVDNELR